MPGTDLLPQRVYELSQDNESLFQKIRGKCWDEVLHRLHTNPEKIPDVQLIRLFSEMNKVQLQIQKGEHRPDDTRKHNVLEAVKGLPHDRQIDVIEQAIVLMEEVGEDTASHRAVLTQLRGET